MGDGVVWCAPLLSEVYRFGRKTDKAPSEGAFENEDDERIFSFARTFVDDGRDNVDCDWRQQRYEYSRTLRHPGINNTLSRFLADRRSSMSPFIKWSRAGYAPHADGRVPSADG